MVLIFNIANKAVILMLTKKKKKKKKKKKIFLRLNYNPLSLGTMFKLS